MGHAGESQSHVAGTIYVKYGVNKGFFGNSSELFTLIGAIKLTPVRRNCGKIA